MIKKEDKAALRARDFWTSLVLIAVSVFFLIQTTDIPFFETKSAGVESAEWYNSAALVPYLIFTSLLFLAFGLLAVSIRDGGARLALSAIGLGLERRELARNIAIVIILAAYIFCLVPRVDFVICSGLLITALIWGFHRGVRAATWISVAAVLVPSLFALTMYFGSAEWGRPQDDWLALIALAALVISMFVIELRSGTIDRVVKVTPVVAILCPLLLVMAMAFGFRQNVPNRGGIVFSQLEYHYYVTLRPLWQGTR